MELQELRQLIQQSSAEDWNVLPGSETFLRSWITYTAPGEHGSRVDYVAHHSLMSYKNDLDVAIAHGLVEDPLDHAGRTLPWNKWPDDSALHLQLADIFWRGALVDRHRYVPVDGARALLPWPSPVFADVPPGAPAEILREEVTAFHADLIRLIDQTTGKPSEFDRYMREAGFEIID